VSLITVYLFLVHSKHLCLAREVTACGLESVPVFQNTGRLHSPYCICWLTGQAWCPRAS
jgi:hypothetical protein